MNERGNPTRVSITGDVTVDGTIAATGDITSDADVKAGAISLKQHKYGGVQAGGALTAVPQVRLVRVP